MNRSNWCAFALLCAASFLAACSLVKNLGEASAEANRAVDRFHEQLNAEKDDAIYDAASPQFRSATTRDVLHGYLSRIRRKMGACTASHGSGFNINSDAKGTFMSLQRETQCANGPLQEDFNWQMVNGNAILVEYTAKSPQLSVD